MAIVLVVMAPIVVSARALALARVVVIVADQADAEDAGYHRSDEADHGTRHGSGEAEERMCH